MEVPTLICLAVDHERERTSIYMRWRLNKPVYRTSWSANGPGSKFTLNRTTATYNLLTEVGSRPENETKPKRRAG